MYKNGISKNCKLVSTTFEGRDLPRFVTKNELKFVINHQIIYNVNKLKLKLHCLDQIYVIILMHKLL